jgi:hypothetical protein
MLRQLLLRTRQERPQIKVRQTLPPREMEPLKGKTIHRVPRKQYLQMAVEDYKTLLRILLLGRRMQAKKVQTPPQLPQMLLKINQIRLTLEAKKKLMHLQKKHL